MTIADLNRNDPNLPGDADREESLRYLLGELDARASERFEKRLADEPDLSDRLLEQANLITAVARTTNVEVLALAKTTSVGPPPGEAQHWGRIAVLVSVAACIALIFQAARMASEPKTVASIQNHGLSELADGFDESTLIAKAWASSSPRRRSGTGRSGRTLRRRSL